MWLVWSELSRFLFQVDGKIRLTFRALLVPGLLTEDYFAGRRERYEKPFRLYLVLLSLSMLLAPSSNAAAWEPEARARGFEVTGGLRELFHWFEISFRFINVWMMLATVGALTVVYRRRGVRFAEHFVFALHAYALFYALSIALLPIQVFSETTFSIVSVIAELTVLILALRRVHRESWSGALWAGLKVATLAMFIVVGTALVAGGVYALWAK